MTRTFILFLLAFAAALLGVACSEPDSATPATTTVAETAVEGTTRETAWSPLAKLAASDLKTLLAEMTPTWDGFDPTEHPAVVLLVEDDGSITTGFTVNHPAPSAVGSATPVDGQAGVFYLSELTSPIDLPPNGFFDWGVDVGGVPSFILTTEIANEFAPAGSDAWRALFVHEMFHLHQRSWTGQRFGQGGGQYDYSLDNLELVLLEDAALVAAIEAFTLDGATQALEHFVALRAVRLESFPSTALDEQQEASEGTAQWFEWRSTGRQEPVYGGSITGMSLDDPEAITEDPRLYIAFRRFYLTGGTIMELLARGGFVWLEPIEAGARPAELLRDAVVVDVADRARLIDQARQIYDGDGRLSGLAQRWSETTAVPSN